jgi:hypothetical protein
MLAVLGAEPLLANAASDYAPKPDYRPLTKFENRGLKLGHGVWDLVFRRPEAIGPTRHRPVRAMRCLHGLIADRPSPRVAVPHGLGYRRASSPTGRFDVRKQRC